jgi:CRISPR-associated protein Cmr2
MRGDLVFRFTLGPVQGFIAQAWHTRDLWAGSFLLSWLAAKAMVAVRSQTGCIKFPEVDLDPLILAMEQRRGQPVLATVPNQFKATVPAGFDAKEVEAAVQGSWRGLGDAVYDRFVAPVVSAHYGRGTKDIWERQIAGFWEISWVLGKPDGMEGTWIVARKNWRNHRQPDQGGERCRLMGEWQEISGHDRLGEHRQRDDFWKAMQGGDHLELRDGERLCAIALVKRFFPRLSRHKLCDTIGWVPGGDPDRTGSWPSLGHIAAASWLSEVAREEEVATSCDSFASYVQDRLSPCHFREQHPRIACVAAIESRAFSTGPRTFPQLDANFFRLDDLRNRNSLPLYNRHNNAIGKREDERARSGLIALHNAIVDAAKEAGVKFVEPPPYYAMLLMDGDEVGELLDGNQDVQVSRGLSAFTKEVEALFTTGQDRIQGIAIYAGGGDVLALTTLEAAIPAAVRLARAYRDAFAQQGVSTKQKELPDISGAIVFADHHEQFRAVVTEAHDLLKNRAKDGNGRASLAVAVLMPSGIAVSWVGKWQLPGGIEPPLAIGNLAGSMPFSNRFPYNLRARYIVPAGDRFEEIGFTNADLKLIFRHELGKSRGAAGTSVASVADMLVISRPSRSAPHEAGAEARPAGLDENGLLLARFLNQYGLLK